MPRGFIGILFFLLVLKAGAGQLPLTAKDVSLMLRGGDSFASVTKELSIRHFVDTIDPEKEQTLRRAGATQELITALKNGTYSLPPEQTALAQQKIRDDAQRRAAETERSKQFDTLYQADLARERASKSATTAQSGSKNVISEVIKGDLVRVQNDKVAPVGEEALAEKKLIALYFSAHWCAPCRKFTPQLVDYYNRVAPENPGFEIVFVSFDRSAEEMQNYMREVKMPWPAIDYAKLESKEAIRKYAGKGIPCLVLVDPSGRVVSDSYDGEKYLGPAKVMADLDTIFAGVAARKVAARP